MNQSIAITTVFESDFTRKLIPAFARQLQRRFALTVSVREGDAPAEPAAVVVLEDRLPEGHRAGSEGFSISTRQENGMPCYHITGASLGLMAGAGRLLREILREGEGIRWPELALDETPALPFRGIYFPMHHQGEKKFIPFNAFAALLYEEGRFDDFEEMLVELMFWGMNAIGIWYNAAMPEPGEGPVGQKMLRMYQRVVEIARSWRLRICLLLTPNMLPYFPAGHPLEAHRRYKTPAGLWGQYEYEGSYCPQVPELRRMMIEKNYRQINLFQPDWVEVFPTDPGGCDCPDCAPWWQHYLALAKEILAPWVDRVPLRGINFWYFWNRDAEALAEALGDDGIINTISTQGAWQEDTRERMRISDRLTAQGYRIVLWPDITMNGGWGMYGMYPFPTELGSLFRKSKRLPYGILPYTEGRYDDFNKFAMLSLAWSPALKPEELTRRVLTGMLGQAMPAEALAAIAAMEARRYAEADALLTAAEGQMDARARDDWRWFALRFHARHAPLGEECHTLFTELQAARDAAGDQPLAKRELARLRRKLAQAEEHFVAYRAELPELYQRVNQFRRHHELCCGTTLPANAKIRAWHHLDEMRALLRELAGRKMVTVQAEAERTSAVDFRQTGG